MFLRTTNNTMIVDFTDCKYIVYSRDFLSCCDLYKKATNTIYYTIRITHLLLCFLRTTNNTMIVVVDFTDCKYVGFWYLTFSRYILSCCEYYDLNVTQFIASIMRLFLWFLRTTNNTVIWLKFLVAFWKILCSFVRAHQIMHVQHSLYIACVIAR